MLEGKEAGWRTGPGNQNGFEEMSPSHAYTKLFFWVNFTFSIDLLKYYSSIFKSGWFSLFLFMMPLGERTGHPHPHPYITHPRFTHIQMSG